ncbi:hypothetical protein [Dethiobacter alkaliphilus]|uniref:Uncharacterized protein n=1 Tax=Dethiobacter alkaliphilus AHT 1 TaxID=555088 RepID=C0GK53_DETAL|nr:hypothetical protein [Dethiobacter alkaliphilus]EEG76323.1 hypothetical protein DealDRAFT_2862 [Dethiobacter alkaliphilus AHT 1]
MMTTFHWIHIIVGAWLAFVNFMPILPSGLLLLNNTVIGIIVAIYNAYILFAKNNTDVKSD